MTDRSTFLRYVHEVFDRLDDPSYLATHPLASLLFGADQQSSPGMLRRALLNAIAQIRPPQGTPTDSISWRRWRALTHRHVDGLTSRQIAAKLQISLRQAQRDHLDGVEAVAALLWSKHEQRARQSGSPEPPLPWREDLETELVRAGAPADAEPGGVSLDEVVASVLETLRALTQRQGARVDVGIPEGLSLVDADRAAIRQLFLCLLAAALHDRLNPKISLAASEAGGRVEVTLDVEEESPRRAVSEIDGEVVTLLGTARRFAQLQRGTLDLRGLPDDFSGFGLSLPATSSRTVLVIDDNPDLAELFRTYLTGTRYRAIQARTVPLALRLAGEIHPDVITLDVLMPSQDGWQILQLLRANPILRDIPIVVCSIVPERPLAMSLGADAFLTKPVTAKSLLSTLDSCLRGR